MPRVKHSGLTTPRAGFFSMTTMAPDALKQGPAVARARIFVFSTVITAWYTFVSTMRGNGHVAAEI